MFTPFWVFFIAMFGLACTAGAASASTICVPGYFAGCPNNGTNIAVANLETALGTDASDGNPDTVKIGALKYVDPDSLETSGSDPLNIEGSGTDKTIITSSSTGNIFVANLSYSGRPVDMSDLTIEIPASFPNSGGSGSAIQATGGEFDNVDIRSLNTGSDGASSLAGNLVWKNSRIYAADGGTLGVGISNNNSHAGKLEIVNTKIVDPLWGVDVEHPEVPVIFKRSEVISPIGYGVFVGRGGVLRVENSVVRGAGQSAVYADAGTNPSSGDIDVAVKTSTFLASATLSPAISIKNNGPNDVDVAVSDSILAGYNESWLLATPGSGINHLSFAYSNFKATGTATKPTEVDTSGPGNIDKDPELTDDLHLKPGSPSIDAASPNSGIIDDFDGNVRPQDGDGDGSAIVDQGAFEAAKLPSCKNTPELCPAPPDHVKPRLTKIKLKSPKGKKPSSLRFALTEKAKVTISFRPKGKGKGKKSPKAVVLSVAGKSGNNLVTLSKKKLKKGKYQMKLLAKDAAGNSSRPVIRIVRVN